MNGRSKLKGRIRYRKLLAVITIFSMLTSILPVFPVYAGVDPESSGQTHINGEFVVYVLNGSEWQEAGGLSFDRFLREKQLDLNSHVTDPGVITLKIVQRGGNAAHLDSVFLGAATPSKVDGDEGLPLKKLSVKDNDVINLDEDGVEVTFSAPEGNAMLAVTGRIEDAVITKTPFHYPVENLYREIDERAAFYSYRLDSKRGNYEIGSMIDKVSADQAFFKEYSTPGTGHPEGYTYGWVMNDDKNLYVVMDFTSDNTMDGDKDYGKVYVKTAAGVKEFKVSVPDTTWGKPHFVYTDKVGYQHKAYEFVIPLSEIDASSGAVQLAFAAYGTAAPPVKPALAYSYNPSANNYLVAYGDKYSERIYAEIIGADGSGGPIEWVDYSKDISDYEYGNYYQYNPAVAFDSVNKRYLVVWEKYYYDGTYRGIYGRFVDEFGEPDGGIIEITRASHNYNPAVAFDAATEKFLVVWEKWVTDESTGKDDYDIYGSTVDADSQAPEQDFAICSDTLDQGKPAVATDSTDNLFFVTWQTVREGTGSDIDGVYLDPSAPAGGRLGSQLSITQAGEAQEFPAVAYDSDQDVMLVVWEDARAWEDDNDSLESDIYGQFVGDSSLIGSNFIVVSKEYMQRKPKLSFDSSNRNFLVIWEGDRETVDESNDIWIFYAMEGRFLRLENNNAVMLGTDFLAEQYETYDLYDFSIAFNPTDVNFLAAYTVFDGYYEDDLGIGFTLIQAQGGAPANHAPVANGAAVQTNQDTSLPIALSATDVDTSDTLNYSIVSPPQHGSLSALAGNETTYTPSTGYSGPDSFTFKANDGKLDSNVATVSITVRPVGNQSPGGGGISLPSAPLNLRLVSNKDAIHLVWDPVKESNIKGYHVYRSEKGSSSTPMRLTEEPQKDVQFKDRSAMTGKTYIYYVIAVNTYGWESLKSNIVEAALAVVRGAIVMADVPSNAWYKDYVEKLLLKEVLDGYTDGTFRPNGKITRAEFAKMLCLAMGWEVKNPDKASFSDVAESSWAYKYIETGVEKGVLHGYKEDGMFRPDRFISREEMAKIIAMTSSLPGADSTLKDIDTSWAKEFINACVKAGIINGYPGDSTFRPKNSTTRAEAAAMIARMLKD